MLVGTKIEEPEGTVDFVELNLLFGKYISLL